MVLMFNKETGEVRYFHTTETPEPEFIPDTYTEKQPPHTGVVFNNELNGWELISEPKSEPESEPMEIQEDIEHIGTEIVEPTEVISEDIE